MFLIEVMIIIEILLFLNSYADSNVYIENPHEAPNKSYVFDRITVNHVVNNAQYRPKSKNNLISGKLYDKKYCSQKQNLNNFNRHVQLADCINHAVKKIPKIRDVETEHPLGCIGSISRDVFFTRNTAIHSLKDLIQNNILNQTYQTKSSQIDEALRNKNITNTTNNILTLLTQDIRKISNGTSEYNAMNKSGPNFLSKSSVTMRINSKHVDMSNTGSLLSETADFEKNTSDDNAKEIMIIEIPIKSPKMHDKNILVDLNDLKDMQTLHEKSKGKEPVNDIECSLHNKLLFFFSNSNIPKCAKISKCLFRKTVFS